MKREPSTLELFMCTMADISAVLGALLMAAGLYLCLAFVVGEALACDWVDSMVYSAHKRKAENSRTVGLGCENVVSPDLRQMYGAYDNSSNNFSMYAGYVWAPLHQGNWHYGVLGGVATGYRSEKFAPIPLGGLVATWEGRDYGANFTLIPVNGGVVNLMFKRRWQ